MPRTLRPTDPDPANDLLPPQGYTLREFNRCSLRLYESRPDENDETDPYSKRDARLIQFAISGRHPDDNIQAHVDLLPLQPPPSTNFTLTRDFDSLLCISENLSHITRALSVFPIPPFKHTLNRSLHLHVPGPGPPLHKIPNTAFASIGERITINLFFPGLYSIDRLGPQLTQTEMATLYQSIIRPAAIAIAPTAKASWPLSYTTEMFRTTQSSGTHSLGSVLIAADDVHTFGFRVIGLLQSEQWGQDAFFFTEVRGHKDASRHNPQGLAEPHELFMARSQVDLGKMADGLDLEVLMTMNNAPNVCCVDVGLEASVEGSSVFWRTDAHHRILKEMFPTWDEQKLRRHTDHHANYKRDLVAQFTQISGFRYEAPARHNPSHTHYLNVYHTDKAPTYRLSRTGVSNSVEPDNILTPPSNGHLSAWYIGMYNIYSEAWEQEYSGAARYEARVPIAEAHKVLTSMDPDTLFRGTLVIPPRQIWEFKRIRLLALWTMCQLQQKSAGNSAAREHALVLRATALWMLNALNSRPREGPAFNQLADYILPHTEDSASDSLFTMIPTLLPESFNQRADAHYWDPEHQEDDDEGDETERFSYMPFGVFMTRNLILHPQTDCPRFEHSPWRWISKKHWPIILKYDWHTLQSKVSNLQLIRSRHPDHVVRPSRPTRLVETPEAEDQDEDGEDSFDISRLRTTTVSAGHDEGEDLLLRDQVFQERHEIGDLLKNIWRTFPKDIFIKSPAVRGARGAHIRLTKSQRESATIEIFHNPNLAHVFMHCKVKRVDDLGWETNIQYFFLAKGDQAPPTGRTWRGMAYWNAWGMLKEDPNITARQVQSIRSQISTRLRNAVWLPMASADRPWNTRSRTDGEMFPGNADSTVTAPVVLLNPSFRMSHIQWRRGRRSDREPSEDGETSEGEED